MAHYLKKHTLFLLCTTLLGTAPYSYAMKTDHDNPNQELMLLSAEQRTNIARLDENKFFISDIQKNIALSMIADFLCRPKTLPERPDAVSSMINNMWMTESSDTITTPENIEKQLSHAVEGHTDQVSSVVISGNKIVTGSGDTTAKIWDANTGQLLHTLTGHTDTITQIVINGDKIVTACHRMAKIWNIQSGQLLHTYEYGYLISISNDMLMIGTDDPDDIVMKIRSINNNQLLHTFTEYSPGGFSHATIADNKVIAGPLWNNSTKIWDITNSHLLHTLAGHTDIISSVAAHGNKVVTGSHDKTVMIWDITNGQLLHTLTGHTGLINSVAINDNKLATGSNDGSAKIWDINTGKLLHTYIAHEITHPSIRYIKVIQSVAIDNYKLVVGLRCGKIMMWPLSVDWHAKEFKDPNHALFWIKHTILPLQANLIARAYAATQAGKTFIITTDTDDAHLWITLPMHVRTYLCQHLYIELRDRRTQELFDSMRKFIANHAQESPSLHELHELTKLYDHLRKI